MRNEEDVREIVTGERNKKNILVIGSFYDDIREANAAERTAFNRTVEEERRENVLPRSKEEAINRYNDSLDPDKEWFIFDGRELRNFLE